MQVLGSFAQAEIRAELGSLLGHFGGQLLGEDLGKAGHVVNVLLGIKRGELAAEVVKAVDNSNRHAAQSGIERSKEAHRPAANNRDVNSLHGEVRGYRAGRCKLST